MNEMIDREVIPWFGYRRRRRSEMYALQIVETLALAVKMQVPIVSILGWLLEDLNRSSIMSRMWAQVRWSKTRRWSSRLKRLIRDLSEGQSLGLSLERHLGSQLPPYYSVAVQKAEAEDQLEIVLPLMAKRIQYQQAVADDRFPYMPLLIFQVSVILLVLLLQEKIIVPIFFAMARDFNSAPSLWTGLMLAWVNTVLAVCFLVGMLLLFVLKRASLREALLPWVPFIAREKRRLLVRDLAQSMGVFMASGEDVLGAARWSLNATVSPWLKTRLQTFIDRVSGGEHWAQAWEGMELGSYTYPWLMANAAARQDPQGGFETLSEWLHQDISHTTRTLRRWFTPCVVIVLGMLVLTIAGTLFGMMGVQWELNFTR